MKKANILHNAIRDLYISNGIVCDAFQVTQSITDNGLWHSGGGAV